MNVRALDVAREPIMIDSPAGTQRLPDDITTIAEAIARGENPASTPLPAASSMGYVFVNAASTGVTIPDGTPCTINGQTYAVPIGSGSFHNTGDQVLPQQTIVTGPNSYAVFQVADGSTFDVYPNAQLIFRNNRGDWSDLLEILLGKVKIQIQHVGGVPNHNKVRTPTAVIAVHPVFPRVVIHEDWSRR